MLSNTERREAAKRKLTDRLEAEQRARHKRKVVLISVSAAVAVALVATVTTVVVKKILDDREAARWTSCEHFDQENKFAQLPSSIEEYEQRVGPLKPEERQQMKDELAKVQAAAKKQKDAPRPGDQALKEGTEQVLFTTNQGPIPTTFTRDTAPCNTAAVLSLVENGYYNGSDCHRLTTADTLKVLQCGDPTGTGFGSPTWSTIDEPPTHLKPVGQPSPDTGAPQAVVYPRGTVAIANSNREGSAYGQQPVTNSGSAQMFFVVQDSQLPPNFAVVGTVDEAGLKVLDKVYAGGVTPTPGNPKAQDGEPKIPITIETATVE
ncbi:peptidylprolyl isomerase [Gordonia sp. ABSL1-1]|uniref:peptidylprolyl isomerase n=1 Tax=Gordonia sp. ABSL1-1 TaxID=3053923 RepID=UPI0025747861|nr:peptidylprolyl isomerase [Gordonia sp. ABSL1-1]MDL9936442.1 peptidylprolyl isomerase [Gordonia sp. ABSL1-1]